MTRAPHHTLGGLGIAADDNAGPELVRQKTGAVWGRMNGARSVPTVTWTVVIP